MIQMKRMMMIRNYPVLILLFIVIAVNHQSVAQSINDQELWMNVDLKTEINKKLSIAIIPELRLEHQMSEFEDFNCEFEATYKLSKKLAADLSYRTYTNHHSDDTRIQTGLSYKFNFLKLKFTSRAAYYASFKSLYPNEWSSNHTDHVIRLRNNVSKSIKKFDISVLTDLRSIITNQSILISSTRIGFGLNYELTNNVTLQMSNFVQTKYAVTNTYNYVISIGAEYKFKSKQIFNPKKKSKKEN